MLTVHTLNLLKPSGYWFKVQKFYILPTKYLYILYLSQEKHRSFPYTTINDRLL